MSTLGILAWRSRATPWLFAASQRCGRGDRESVRVLAYPGLLAAWLALDDQFQLHETLIPDYLCSALQTATPRRNGIGCPDPAIRRSSYIVVA
jgi:hypothetical protein